MRCLTSWKNGFGEALPRIVLALAGLLAGAGGTQAASITCYWVGQVHTVTNQNTQTIDYSAPVWGDASGWSANAGGSGSTCPGGYPTSTAANTYNVVISNANAAVIAANKGQIAAVTAVNNGGNADINPTLASLMITNSTLGLGGPERGTLTTGWLTATGSSIGGGTVLVNGTGLNTIQNLSLSSTDLTFQGNGAAAAFTGSLTLGEVSHRVGRTGLGPIRFGQPSTLTGSSTALTTFNDVIISAGNLARSTGTLVETGGGMNFTGTNFVNGPGLKGQITVAGGVTTFTGATLFGSLHSENGGVVQFLGGATSGSAWGFSQSGTGRFSIQDLTASGGTFDGVINLSNSSGNANTLTGVTVHSGATLSIDSGVTTFSGVNAGTLVTNGGSLILTGGVKNTGGTISQASGPLIFQDLTLTGGQVTGGATLMGANDLRNVTLNGSYNVVPGAGGSAGTDSLTSVTLHGQLHIDSGTTTLNHLVSTSAAGLIKIGSGAQLINNGILDIQAPLTITGSVNNSGGGISGIAGDLTLAGATISGGRISTGGALSGNNTLAGVILAGTYTIDGGTTTINAGVNNGTLNIAGGRLALAGDVKAGTIVELSGHPVQIDGVMLHDGQVTGGGIVANGVNSFSHLSIGGTLEVDSGNTAAAGLTFSANPGYLVKGGVLTLSSNTNGPVTVQSAGELDLKGTIAVNNVTSQGTVVALDGSATLNSLSTTGGRLEANAGATLGFSNANILNTVLAGSIQASGSNLLTNPTFADGILTVTGGNTTLSGSISDPAAAIHVADNATLTLGGGAITGGNLSTSGTGQIHVIGGTTLNATSAQGGYNILIDATLLALGADWDVTPGATTRIGSAGTLQAGGAVNNNGGTIDILGGGILDASQGFVQNSGRTTIDGSLMATGGIEIDGGVFTDDSTSGSIFGDLRLNNDAVGNVSGSFDILGSVDLNSSSTFTGDHTIAGDFINHGTVEPGDAPGIIHVSGDYLQPGGALDIEVGADAASLLIVGGQANLSGTLDLMSWAGFQPTDGQELTILEFSSLFGQFSNVEQSGFTGGQFDVIYNLHDVTIRFDPSGQTPEPSTVVLAGCGCLLLVFRRIRQRWTQTIRQDIHLVGPLR